MKQRAIFSPISILLFVILATMVVAAGPTINPISAQTVSENSPFSVSITATTPDSGSTSFNASISPQPSSAFLASLTLTRVNDTLATLTGTPTFADAGVYTVAVTATDANSSDARSFSLTVTDVPAPGPQLVIEAVSFGNEDQRKSNPDAEDDEDQDEFVTDTLTIRNTGGSTATGITFTPTFERGNLQDYLLNFSNAPASLAPGESRTVTARIRVPEFMDAVDVDLEEGALIFGQLVVTSNSGTVSSNTVNMDMQVENHLRIKKVKVCHENDCENADDGDTIDDVKPGDHIQVTVEIENTFAESDREDVDIEDIEVELDTDDDEDLDLSSETEDVGDLSANDEDSITVDFDVEDDADDGTAEFTVAVSGEDEFGGRHGELIRVRLDINRERHEVAVRDVVLSPETLSCARVGQSNTLNVRVTAENIGRDDEEDVSVEAKINELNLGQITRDILVDENDEETLTFNLNIPAGIQAGSYEVEATTFINRDEVSDRDSAVFTVPDCDQQSTNVGFDDDDEEDSSSSRRTSRRSADADEDEDEDDEERSRSDVVVQTTPTLPPVTAPITSTSTRRGSGSGSFGGSGYVMLLLVIIVVLVLVGVGLIVAIAKKGDGKQH